MSRGGGGRGSFRGGRGGGRGGFPGGLALPPMGLSFADIASLSREPTALYPPMEPLPILEGLTLTDKEDIANQMKYEDAIRRSKFYIVEPKKATDLPRYSDKYRPTAATRPTLKRKDLNPDFFPREIFEAYFNPKKKRKIQKKQKKNVKANFDDLEKEEQEGGEDEDDEDKPKDDEEQPDYDEDEEEDDNDYVEEYFDNGEGDDEDPLGGGGGDEGGGRSHPHVILSAHLTVADVYD